MRCCLLASARRSLLHYTLTSIGTLPALKMPKHHSRRFKTTPSAHERPHIEPSSAIEVSARTKPTSLWAWEGSLPPTAVRARPSSRIHCAAKGERKRRCPTLGWDKSWLSCRCAHSTPQTERCARPKAREGLSSPRYSALDRSCTATSRMLHDSGKRNVTRRVHSMTAKQPGTLRCSAQIQRCGCGYLRDRTAV